MSICVYINSANRAGQVITHELLEGVIKYYIVVPHDQYKEYKKYHSKKVLIRLPKDCPQFLSSQRQWVMENSTYEYVWYMDDDLEFLTRYEKDSKLRLRKSDSVDVAAMCSSVIKHLSEIPVVGISTRLGNNRVEAPYHDITRITRCYAIHRKSFMKAGITFAPFEPFLAQDFHVGVSMLNAGHKNRVLYEYAQEDKGGSNSEGGCSSYRSPELMKKVALWMADNHPEIQVKIKSSKSWKNFKGTGADNKRYDMVVQWKKAYRPPRQKGGLAAMLKKR